MEEKEYLEELKADQENPNNLKRKVGMNGELIAGITVISISLFWLLISVFIFKTYLISNVIILGIGILILGLGLIKYQKVKKTDLDF